MIEAAEAIEEITKGLDFDRFVGSRRDRSAVLHELTVIGESAAHISSDFRERYPEVPWAEMVGSRNVIVHGYFGLDWPRIWQTVIKNVPQMKDQIVEIVEIEFRYDERR